MGKYQDDLSQEKKPAGLIPEGQREIMVISMEVGKSKAGNNQFKTTIEDVLTGISTDIYLVNEPKKRWRLKSLLDAVNVPKTADGKHDWSEEDVIGKKAIAIVEHYSEPWIDREGVERNLRKANIRDFKQITLNESTEQWSE